MALGIRKLKYSKPPAPPPPPAPPAPAASGTANPGWTVPPDWREQLTAAKPKGRFTQGENARTGYRR